MILVLGGTSDSLKICELLNNENKDYYVSVTTEYGMNLTQKYTKNIILRRMNKVDMIEFISKNNINLIIDSTHPYATEVSKNAIECSKIANTKYIRYERKSLLEDIDYKKIIKVGSYEEACDAAYNLGKNIFLGTGSKTLKLFVDKLNNKNITTRVLPTSDVIKQCEDIGLNADNIIAMKGPFSESINEEIYKHYNIDVVITKESGEEGGFIEKVKPCENLGIDVIVIKREEIDYPNVINKINDIKGIFSGRGITNEESGFSG